MNTQNRNPVGVGSIVTVIGIASLVAALQIEFTDADRPHSTRMVLHAWTALHILLVSADAHCETFVLLGGVGVIVQVRNTHSTHARHIPSSTNACSSQALGPALADLCEGCSDTLDVGDVNCLRLLRILAKLSMVDSLLFSLAASVAVQALIASTLPSMRGRDYWQTHAQVARVLHRLASVPSLHAFMSVLGLREWLFDVIR